MKCLLAFLPLAVTTDALATDVLLLHAAPDPDWVTDVVTNILSTARFTSVDTWNGETSTPTLTDLAAYDVVMLMPNNPFLDPVTLGTRLAAYVDMGGGVVDTVFSVNEGSRYVDGPYYTQAYRPFEGTRHVTTTGQSLVPVLPGHDLLMGVSSFTSAGFYGPDVVMNPNATLVANWSSGVPLIAANVPTGAGVVVGINSLMVSGMGSSDGWDSQTDGAVVLGNALEYAATGQVSPRPTIAAQGSCPGTSQIIVEGATPGGTLTYLTVLPGGSFTIPSGPCAGSVLPIRSPRLRGQRPADAAGAATMTVVFPSGSPACGAHILVIDMATCRWSNIGQLPD